MRYGFATHDSKGVKRHHIIPGLYNMVYNMKQTLKVAKKENRCMIMISQTRMVGEHVDPERTRILCTVCS